jgi:hypothetical protein
MSRRITAAVLARRAPATYGELAQRCGFEGQRNGRWFGQVTDLIDAAGRATCAKLI